MSDNEGPLSKLMRGLGIENDLPPIAALKRIKERPVNLNAETLLGNKPAGDFEMAPTPELMSDTGIHRISREPDARAYDLDYEYTSYAPPGERWTCIDLNTYDGGSEGGVSACIGRGATEGEARANLLDQIRDCEEAPKPRPGYVVHSSPFEPPTIRDVIYRDPDEE